MAEAGVRYASAVTVRHIAAVVAVDFLFYFPIGVESGIPIIIAVLKIGHLGITEFRIDFYRCVFRYYGQVGGKPAASKLLLKEVIDAVKGSSEFAARDHKLFAGCHNRKSFVAEGRTVNGITAVLAVCFTDKNFMFAHPGGIIDNFKRCAADLLNIALKFICGSQFRR